VLRKLAKKHGLKKIGRDKACISTPTDATGYKPNSIYSLVVSQPIDHRLFSGFAIGTFRLPCCGIQRVGPIECY